jgi:hypothetical protein
LLSNFQPFYIRSESEDVRVRMGLFDIGCLSVRADADHVPTRCMWCRGEVEMFDLVDQEQ